MVPLVLQCATGDVGGEDDDLRENCFQTLESLLLRCHSTIGPYVQQIVELCKTYVRYDPNMAVDSEPEDGDDAAAFDEDVEMFDEEEEGFEGFEDGDWDEGSDYSDDDDISWKVRRAAAKALAAVISTRPKLLASLYTSVGPALVSRFSEREDTVKLDVFNTFIELLHQTKKAVSLQDMRCVALLAGHRFGMVLTNTAQFGGAAQSIGPARDQVDCRSAEGRAGQQASQRAHQGPDPPQGARLGARQRCYRPAPAPAAWPGRRAGRRQVKRQDGGARVLAYAAGLPPAWRIP